MSLLAAVQARFVGTYGARDVAADVEDDVAAFRPFGLIIGARGVQANPQMYKVRTDKRAYAYAHMIVVRWPTASMGGTHAYVRSVGNGGPPKRILRP